MFMWPYFGGGFAGGFWWIMPILMIVFWGLIIWGIVSLVRRGGGWGNQSGTESAMDILKRRYASGEITREEFEDKKKAIT
jgi:putative membrane protein